MMANPTEYDGFYFLNDPNDFSMELRFFNFTGKFEKGKPIDHSDLGHKYYVAFFRVNSDGTVRYDDHFEAIFRDPVVYINNMRGSNFLGCIVRKTNKSGKWFKDYLKTTKERIKIAATAAKVIKE